MIAVAVCAAMLLLGCAPAERRGPVILAASSLQQPLEAIAREWEAAGNDAPVFSFASSATLARQIETGSPADIFISADDKWTDYIVSAGGLAPDAVRRIAGNSLVVAASTRRGPIGATGEAAAIRALRGSASIASGDPETVPLGRYAREAAEYMGLWDDIAPRLIRAPSSGAALKLVLMGEADIGILYASDAARRDDIGVIHALSATSHSPITYRALQLPGSAHPDAARFMAFAETPESRAVFDRYGFSRP